MIQRIAMLVLVLGGLAAGAFGQAPPAEDRRRAQVEAAVADALRKLEDEVLATRVGRLMTVGEFVERTETRDELLQTLQRAEQIGGPRWLDDQTCQVQLEMSGPRVAQALIQIAATKQRQSPIPAEALAQQLAVWKDRTFSATGSSTSANIETVHPVARADAWAAVDDPSRMQALAAAHEDAVRQSLDSIRPLPVDGQHTVADVLKVRSVEERARQWFASRPVTRVEFQDDLEVRLTLSAPADELATGLRDAISKQTEVPVNLDEEGWARFETALAERMSPPVGRARATVIQAQTRPAAMILPARAPAWVGDQLDAAGSATSGRSKLRAARIAEAEALRNLAAKIDALRLTDDLTLAAAARQDPRVKQAIDRSLVRARVYKTAYGADSSATVHVVLDLQDLWQSLRQAQ